MPEPLTACKQYCLAAGATQGNIAYTRTVSHNLVKTSVNQIIYQDENITVIQFSEFDKQVAETPFTGLGIKYGASGE